LEDKVVKLEKNKCCFFIQQAALAVLLFLFFTGVSLASFHDMVEEGRPLQEVVDYALDYGMSVESLVTELIVAGKDGRDIICALFRADVERYQVIAAALDTSLLNSADVANWALECGGTMQDVQTGYSMAGEKLPGYMVFLTAEEYEKNAKEYLYNPPSPSK
jgi:hypothetical protein